MRLPPAPSKPPRGTWIVATLVFVYLVLHEAFAYETHAVGLFSPGGTLNAGVIALGVVYLASRVAVRFFVPAIVVYVGAKALARWMLAARDGSASRRDERRRLP
jgi:hypothetical protein